MKKLLVLCLVVSMSLSLVACGNKEAVQPAKETDHIDITEAEKPKVEESETEEAGEDTDAKEAYEAEEEAEAVDFSLFSGEYCFSSGVGAWSTMVTINEDGSFDGEFSDMDMGDTGEGYPDGTMYLSKFHGHFQALEQKEEFVYVTRLADIQTEKEENTEEITGGIRYIYSGPHGFEQADRSLYPDLPEDEDTFEFYLPGKKLVEFSEDFLVWTSLRFWSIYPARLPYKAFYNVGGVAGFEQIGEESIATGQMPDSLKVDIWELVGDYQPEFNNALYLSIYTDVSDDGRLGNIYWRNSDKDLFQDVAYIYPSDNGYKLMPEFGEAYNLIITDNTSGHIVFHVYNSTGYDCGEYVMTGHYES